MKMTLIGLTKQEKIERHRLQRREWYWRNRGNISDKNRNGKKGVSNLLCAPDEKPKKQKIIKIKIIKPVKKSVGKPRSEYYVKDIELTYELILSKGRGSPSDKLKDMLYLICSRVNRRQRYFSDDDRYDVIMGSYVFTLENYSNVNTKKYTRSLPYITEIVKRRQADEFKKLMNKGVISGRYEGNIKHLNEYGNY